MNTIKSGGNDYTNKEFADALLELKEHSGLSYMQIAIKAGLSDTYLINIVKRKNLPPKDEYIEKIAQAFGVKPEYFKEYRQRRLAEKINTLDFHKDNYDVPLSEEEVEYLKKIIEKHTGEKL
jgi:transcriptional regulator with XRE-family HTH domain